MAGTGNGNTMPITTPGITGPNPAAGPGGLSNSIGNNPQSVDSGIGLGSPRSITSASSTTLYSPKIQGTSPSLLPGSDNSPEKATSGSSWGHLTSFFSKKVEITWEKFRSEKGKNMNEKWTKEKSNNKNSYPAKFRLVPNYYKLCETTTMTTTYTIWLMCTSKNNDSQDDDKS